MILQWICREVCFNTNGSKYGGSVSIQGFATDLESIIKGIKSGYSVFSSDIRSARPKTNINGDSIHKITNICSSNGHSSKQKSTTR